jgi:ribulose-5-phosphate 4-epimerase/fuculose-1-phosphate aldolase
MAMAHDMARTDLKNRVSPEEWETRVQLAAAYRLVETNGWDDLIYTHISARVPGTDHEFLLNPLGLTFDEICASNLVKINLNGEVLDDSPYRVNKAGFVIHSAIHEAREDAMCVLHLHSDYGVAVSMQEEGLLPASQTAMVVNFDLAYHDYEGIATREDEKERLVANIGTKSSVILKNHGTLTVGKSVGDAYEKMYRMERACKYQILAQASGKPFAKPQENAMENVITGALEVVQDIKPDRRPWDAMLRRLDRIDSSFRD